MKDEIEHFSKKLRKLRLDKDIMQKQLAKDLDISPNYYSELERADKIPSLDLVFKIANFYKVSLDYLFSDNNSHNYYIQNNITEKGVNGVVNNSFDKDEFNKNFEKLLTSKDETILSQKEQIIFLQNQLNKK